MWEFKLNPKVHEIYNELDSHFQTFYQRPSFPITSTCDYMCIDQLLQFGLHGH